MSIRELSASLIRVLIVDDDIEMQDMVETILNLTADIQLIGKGDNGKDALALCKQLHPDVLLLDVMMPVMGGVEAASLLRNQFPDIKILALSSLHTCESVHAMLQNGADGYISKSKLYRDLAENIRATYHGKKVLSSEAFSHLTPFLGRYVERNFGLSDREREILALMATGLNKPQIAEKLDICQSTVKYHSENIYSKFGVCTRSEALILAAKNNLV